jgi:lysophospholipase L1-like esterase
MYRLKHVPAAVAILCPRRAGIAVLAAASVFAVFAVQAARAAEAPEWVEPMRKVHARFDGREGSFAQFGDSITVSMAFWAALQWEKKNVPPEVQKAFETVSAHMLREGWGGKGPEQGNQGRMTIRWAHENIDGWLKRLNPEAAVMMFGTNDIGSVPLDEYEQKTREVVKKCLDNGTVLILTTIPPRHGRAEQAAQYAEAVRRIARDMKVPLIDYHAEILKRRPDDWDGAAEKFQAYQGYDVPTLIARDGVHPSNPKQYVSDFSPEGLRSNGFTLRNYLTLLRYAEVIERVLGVK